MNLLPVTQSFRLDGRGALVTGAGGGIGLAAAAALATAGAAVTLVARSSVEIEAAAITLGADNKSEVLDVTDLPAVAAFFNEQPAFDILVNNAGINRPKLMTDVSEDDYDAVLGLNLKAAFFVAQAAVRQMIAQGTRGSVIHMSSQMGHVGGARRTLYCASKWGLEGLSKAMALDLATHGIRSNTIAPTFTDTPMVRPFLDDPAFRDDVIARIKLGRLGRVEDLMGAIVFLASDASALMTGTSMIVDGGWTAD